MTPLMLACKNNMKEVIEKLVEFGANINEANILGETPLKIAQMFGHEELALFLIQKYKALSRPNSKK